MRTYLQLEGKLGPRHRPQEQSQVLPNTKMHVQQTTTLKTEKRKTKVLVKKIQGELIAQPLPVTTTTNPPTTLSMTTTPTVTVSAPIMATTAAQTMPVMQQILEMIPVTMHNIAKGKHEKPQPELNSLIPPPMEDAAEAPVFKVREDTPWPNTEPVDSNLFEAKADWPISPSPTPTFRAVSSVPIVKTEAPHTTVIPKAIIKP